MFLSDFRQGTFITELVFLCQVSVVPVFERVVLSERFVSFRNCNQLLLVILIHYAFITPKEHTKEGIGQCKCFVQIWLGFNLTLFCNSSSGFCEIFAFLYYQRAWSFGQIHDRTRVFQAWKIDFIL